MSKFRLSVRGQPLKFDCTRNCFYYCLIYEKKPVAEFVDAFYDDGTYNYSYIHCFDNITMDMASKIGWWVCHSREARELNTHYMDNKKYQFCNSKKSIELKINDKIIYRKWRNNIGLNINSDFKYILC